MPDALLPDPGLGPDALVPVLADVVGQERPVRISVPAVLSEIPRIKLMLDSVRGYLGAM